MLLSLVLLLLQFKFHIDDVLAIVIIDASDGVVISHVVSAAVVNVDVFDNVVAFSYAASADAVDVTHIIEAAVAVDASDAVVCCSCCYF